MGREEGLTTVNLLELLLLFLPKHILRSRGKNNSRLTQNESQNSFAYYLKFYCKVEGEQTILLRMCSGLKLKEI